MRSRVTTLVRAALSAALVLWSAFGASPAHAIVSIDRIDPAIPEPGAALAFAVGLGVVAWSARARRR